VTNLFVFGADGRIIACVLNAPGSIHDSTLAYWGGIYQKLDNCHRKTGGICCVDSAFASNPNPYLICSAQDTTHAQDEEELSRLLEATSLRQASEWGMRAIQSAFPRLKDSIRYEEKGERRRILRLVPLLYNLRLELVGLNQIRNTYVPEWSKDVDFIVDK
jgi:DDE superfamily endonuclease